MRAEIVIAFAWPILAPHNVMWLNWVKGTNNFELFIAHGVRIKFCRWFHRNEAQQLHQMVLRHVAHSARFVIIAPAPTDTDGFCHGYLDMVDILTVPKWLEQHVAKAHSHKVLDRFFAQIVIDPVNLRFIEMLRQ